MNFLSAQLRASPAYARVAPYLAILLITCIQDSLHGPLRYWLYLLKMIVGILCLWQVRSLAPEVRWAFSWEAVGVGVVICALWVGLDSYYPKLQLFGKAGRPWNPFEQFGEHSILGWFFVGVRTLGSALVVPPIEEAFYRSFLYRYLVRGSFTTVPLSHLHWPSVFLTAFIFGFSHYQWLAGIICGLAYQWLVIRKNRLGDAILAHAITNFLLGVWIVWKGAWNFW